MFLLFIFNPNPPSLRTRNKTITGWVNAQEGFRFPCEVCYGSLRTVRSERTFSVPHTDSWTHTRTLNVYEHWCSTGSSGSLSYENHPFLSRFMLIDRYHLMTANLSLVQTVNSQLNGQLFCFSALGSQHEVLAYPTLRTYLISCCMKFRGAWFLVVDR